MAGDETAAPSHPADADPRWPGARRLVAEALGTFALTFVAAGGATMALVSGGDVVPAARAVAPGLLVLGLIYALGDTSGAHFNPAVSLAFALRRLLAPRWLGLYWVAQLGGAVAAALVLRGLFGADAAAGVDMPHVGSLTALALEAIFSAILITVVLGTADRYRVVGPDAALAVGSTIALCGLIGLPIEGASMNPARSLGPALVMLQAGDVWLYVVGPVLGAVIAVLLTTYLHGGEADPGERETAAGSSGRRSH